MNQTDGNNSDDAPIRSDRLFEYGCSVQMVGILLSLVLPVAGAIICLLIAFVIRCQRGAGALAVFAAGMLIFWSIVFFPVSHHVRIKPNEGEVKFGVHSVYISLENYADINDGVFPTDISQLKFEGYLPLFPENPYTGEQMTAVLFTDPLSPGDFTYIPIEIDSEIRAFYLIGYGEENYEGFDVDDDGFDDHVLVVLSGHSEDLAEDDILPLQEIFNE